MTKHYNYIDRALRRTDGTPLDTLAEIVAQAFLRRLAAVITADEIAALAHGAAIYAYADIAHLMDRAWVDVQPVGIDAAPLICEDALGIVYNALRAALA